jgi:hypothetical protein
MGLPGIAGPVFSSRREWAKLRIAASKARGICIGRIRLADLGIDQQRCHLDEFAP